LKSDGFIISLKRGLYTINQQFLQGAPLHEYEIGMHLANPSALCCFSAMQYHHLTDQTSRTIYLMTTWGGDHSKLSTYRFEIIGVRYLFIRSKPEFYFGITKEWIGETSFMVTDLERTLIDGLVRPKYCGGMREVISAFESALSRIDIAKIVNYAQKFGVSTSKRLGFILETLDVDERLLKALRAMRHSGFCNLDPSGPRNGKYNKDWMILENI
jgi:predicted transcriptional regulator of viral defense system